LQRTGNFPKSVKIGVRAVGWMADDVLAWSAQRANRPPPAPRQLSEERSQVRSDLKCKTAIEAQQHQIDGQSKPRDGYGMPRHLHKELLRLRALEWRFRQITQLQAEIVALTKVSIPDERTVDANERVKETLTSCNPDGAKLPFRISAAIQSHQLSAVPVQSRPCPPIAAANTVSRRCP
jgi:hypothetical protein